MASVDHPCVRSHVDGRILIAHPLYACPMGGSWPSIQDATLGQQKSAGADTGGELRAPILADDPIQQPVVATLVARPRPAWHDQNVEWWMVVNGVMRLHQQATTAPDEPRFLGNGQDREEAELVLGLPGGRANENTSNGPQKSSTSTSLKITMPTVRGPSPCCCPVSGAISLRSRCRRIVPARRSGRADHGGIPARSFPPYARS